MAWVKKVKSDHIAAHTAALLSAVCGAFFGLISSLSVSTWASWKADKEQKNELLSVMRSDLERSDGYYSDITKRWSETHDLNDYAMLVDIRQLEISRVGVTPLLDKTSHIIKDAVFRDKVISYYSGSEYSFQTLIGCILSYGDSYRQHDADIRAGKYKEVIANIHKEEQIENNRFQEEEKKHQRKTPEEVILKPPPGKESTSGTFNPKDFEYDDYGWSGSDGSLYTIGDIRLPSLAYQVMDKDGTSDSYISSLNQAIEEMKKDWADSKSLLKDIEAHQNK